MTTTTTTFDRTATRFLESLSRTGHVQDAIKASGISSAGMYKRRSADPEFARAWDAALQEHRDYLELTQRHVHGKVGEVSKMLARAAAELANEEGPTALLLPRRLLLRELSDPPTHDLPDGPRVIRSGGAATVFAWGETVELAVAAVERASVDATVVDVGRLAPLDADALVEQANATGKIVIAHGSDRAIAAELAALFADRGILHLDAPVTRVGGTEDPVTPGGEMAVLPPVDRLAQVIQDVADH